MDDGPLKRKLEQCSENELEKKSDFSIGHRGAALQFPSTLQKSRTRLRRAWARASSRCDVTFTKDKQLVCRHSQCDLHTTTNILAVPELAAKCTQPFQPADPATGTPRIGDVLHQRHHARRVQEPVRQDGRLEPAREPRPWLSTLRRHAELLRTDLYATRGTLVTPRREYPARFRGLGAKFTPELKKASVPMPYQELHPKRDYAAARRPRPHPSERRVQRMSSR